MGSGCSLSGISLNHHSGISIIIPASQSGFVEWRKNPLRFFKQSSRHNHLIVRDLSGGSPAPSPIGHRTSSGGTVPPRAGGR